MGAAQFAFWVTVGVNVFFIIGWLLAMLYTRQKPDAVQAMLDALDAELRRAGR